MSIKLADALDLSPMETELPAEIAESPAHGSCEHAVWKQAREEVVKSPSQVKAWTPMRPMSELEPFQPFRTLGVAEWLSLIDDIWLRLLPPASRPSTGGARDHL